MELIKIKDNTFLLKPSVSKKIATYERKIKEIKEQEEQLKQAILEEMEKHNLIKIDTPEITINYIAPTDRETFDSKSFRKDHSDLYDEYIKMTLVKSSVRIKVKD